MSFIISTLNSRFPWQIHHVKKSWSVSSNFMGFVTLPAGDIRCPDQTANWWLTNLPLWLIYTVNINGYDDGFHDGFHNNLVGGWATPLKNMTSSDWIIIPIWLGKIIQMFQTTNQMINYISIITSP